MYGNKYRLENITASNQDWEYIIHGDSNKREKK